MNLQSNETIETEMYVKKGGGKETERKGKEYQLNWNVFSTIKSHFDLIFLFLLRFWCHSAICVGYVSVSACV